MRINMIVTAEGLRSGDWLAAHDENAVVHQFVRHEHSIELWLDRGGKRRIKLQPRTQLFIARDVYVEETDTQHTGDRS